jgi:hypothetical protein
VQQHRVPSASAASNEYHGPGTVRPRCPLANSSTSVLVSGRAIIVNLEKLHISVKKVQQDSPPDSARYVASLLAHIV